MPRRRWRAASAMPWWTRTVAPFCRCRTPRASGIATARARCGAACVTPPVPVRRARVRRRRLRRRAADAGYAGERVSAATRIAVEIVRKRPDQVGSAVHPRRWAVERLLAWLGRDRRLAKDLEATLASATAFLYAASVLLLARRLART
jgi:transposase